MPFLAILRIAIEIIKYSLLLDGKVEFISHPDIIQNYVL